MVDTITVSSFKPIVLYGGKIPSTSITLTEWIVFFFLRPIVSHATTTKLLEIDTQRKEKMGSTVGRRLLTNEGHVVHKKRVENG